MTEAEVRAAATSLIKGSRIAVRWRHASCAATIDDDEGWVTWVGVVGKVGGRGASAKYCGEYCPGNPLDRHERSGTPWTLWTTTTIDSILPNHEIAITHIVLVEDAKSADVQQQPPQPQLTRNRHKPPLSANRKEQSNCNNSNAQPFFLPQPRTLTGIER